MYLSEIPFATMAFDENLRLRNDILRVPLNLTFHKKDIEQEWGSFHLGCYSDNDELLGSLILKNLGKGVVKMRQVAVAEHCQSKGIGQKLVKASEIWAKKKGYTNIHLHARETAVPFYLKLDYKKIGKRFTEVDIPHFKMTKKL